MKYLYTLVVLLVLLLNGEAFAQTNSGGLLARGAYHQNQVFIRWIPSDLRTWSLGNQFGYRVERTLQSVGGRNTKIHTLRNRQNRKIIFHKEENNIT
jgi:hypothetical protein